MNPGAVLEHIFMSASFTIATAPFSISAYASFNYPCVYGDVATGNVTLEMRIGALTVDGVRVGTEGFNGAG